MTTPSETYHEDVIVHLEAIRRAATNGINLVLEISRNGHKYSPEAFLAAVDEVKNLDNQAHAPPANVAAYEGNPQPASTA